MTIAMVSMHVGADLKEVVRVKVYNLDTYFGETPPPMSYNGTYVK